MKPSLRIRAILATIVLPGAALAANITWTGAAGDGLWSNPDNWQGGAVPGSADRADLYATGLDASDPVIDLGGVAQTVGSVYWRDASVRLTNGTMRLALGRAEGNTKSTVNGVVRNGGFFCDVEQLVDGAWKNGDSNGNYVYAKGRVFGDGPITLTGNQNNNLRFEDAAVSVPSLTVRAASVSLINSTLSGTLAVIDGQYADGNFNGTTLVLDATSFSGGPGAPGVFRDGATLQVVRSGGAFQYTPPTASAYDQIIPLVALEGGRLNVRMLSPTVAGSVLTIGRLDRSYGTSFTLSYNDTNQKPIGTFQRVRIVGAENNPAGALAPWAFYAGNWFPLAILDEYGTIGALPVSAYTTGLPTDGGGPWALRRISAGTHALEADADVWQLHANAGGAVNVSLGSHALRVFGSLSLSAWGDKTISADDGGRLVFAGEEIVLVASGSGGMYIDAPIEWQKPEGSELEWPNIVIPEGNKTDGIHFRGADRIRHYGTIMGSASGKYLNFYGDEDRVVHGDLSDSLYIRQCGTGSLTLLGNDNRRARALQVTGGRLVIGRDASSNVNLVTNGVLEVAAGVTLSYSPLITAAGSIEGCGDISSGLWNSSIKPGATVAPGNPQAAGVLSANGFGPTGDFSFLCRFDSETNSVLALSGSQFRLPPGASTATLALKAIPGSGLGSKRVIRSTDEFPVIDWSRGNQKNMRNSANNANVTAENAPNYLAWRIENLSPARLDASEARVFYDDATKTVRLTGIKTVNPTVIMMR